MGRNSKRQTGRIRAGVGHGSVTLRSTAAQSVLTWASPHDAPRAGACAHHIAEVSRRAPDAARPPRPAVAWGAPPPERVGEGGGPERCCPAVSSAPADRDVDVVVIGAGQAGLSTARSLARQGFEPETGFVVLDADAAPGGAWQHRWPSLTVGTTHRVHDLPGLPFEPDAENLRAADAVPAYFAEYERRFGLPVHRPVRVRAVRRTDDDRFRVETDAGDWTARAVVNATGTWTRPFVPRYPGQELFRGRQLHTVDYRSADEFAGRHVVVVGGGASATQLLGEISTGHEHHVGHPPPARLARRALRRGGRPAGRRDGRGGRARGTPSRQRRRGHRPADLHALHPRRARPRRPRAAADVRPHHRGRRRMGGRPVRRRRRDPLGHRLPRGRDPPGPAAAARHRAAASAWTAPTSPANRASTSSATGRRPARSAPTARAGPPPSQLRRLLLGTGDLPRTA